MMIYSANTIAHLHLLEHHRQENKLFWANMIADRQALAYRHRQEKYKLSPIKANGMVWAVIIQRHTSEVMEFMVLHQEKKWRLRNQQDQEELNLINL